MYNVPTGLHCLNLVRDKWLIIPFASITHHRLYLKHYILRLKYIDLKCITDWYTPSNTGWFCSATRYTSLKYCTNCSSDICTLSMISCILGMACCSCDCGQFPGVELGVLYWSPLLFIAAYWSMCWVGWLSTTLFITGLSGDDDLESPDIAVTEVTEGTELTELTKHIALRDGDPADPWELIDGLLHLISNGLILSVHISSGTIFNRS